MSLFLDRQLYFERFKKDRVAVGESYACTLLQWPGTTDEALFREELSLASQVKSYDARRLNIIIAPLDTADPTNFAGFEALVERHNIPGSFLDERSQGSWSFGYCPDTPTSSCLWIHFLLKDVERSEPSAPHSDSPRQKPLHRRLLSLLQRPASTAADKGTEMHEMHEPKIKYGQSGEAGKPYSPKWTRRSFFLRVEGARTDTSTVTLVCFAPSTFLKDDLVDLPQRVDCAKVMVNPHILLEIILYDLYMQLDTTLWELRKIFTVEQEHFGYLTASPTKPLSDIDFSALHLLADYIIMLREGSEALLATLDAVVEHHGSTVSAMLATEGAALLHRQTQTALEYRRRLVRATGERAATFEKRINNLINLFFNHISQQDNAMLMRDSASVKAIAVITLVFLPVTTVATICGSQFFYNGDDGGIAMDPSGWFMFAISTALSVILLLAWGCYAQSLERRFARGRKRGNRHAARELRFSA